MFESEPSLPGASYNDTTRLVCKTLICCSEDDSTLFSIDFQQIPNKSLKSIQCQKRIWENADMFWQFSKLKNFYLKVESNEWYLLYSSTRDLLKVSWKKFSEFLPTKIYLTLTRQILCCDSFLSYRQFLGSSKYTLIKRDWSADKVTCRWELYEYKRH